MALNFRNILELYGINAGPAEQTSFTVAENVDLFFNVFDKSKDDQVSRTEFENILTARKMPTSIADSFFSQYAGGDNYLSETELTAALTAIDASGNGVINFAEALNFYNSTAEVDLDESTNYTQYAGFFSAAKKAMSSLDTSGDSIVDAAEYSAYLSKSGLQGKYASQFIDLFDITGDNQINFEEFLSTYVDWDDNRDGSLDLTNKDVTLREATDFYDLNLKAQKVNKLTSTPSSYKNILNMFNINVKNSISSTTSTVYDVEKNARDFVDVIDANYGDDDDKNDGEVNLEQARAFMTSVGLPESIADTLLSQVGGNLTDDNFETFLSAFDVNSDDSISFEEGLAFFNNITGFGIDIDVAADFDDSETSAFKYYSKHFATAQTLIVSYDTDEDGELDNGTETTTLLKASKIPSSYDTAFINLFDDNGNDSISFQEYFTQMMDWDRNKDGSISLYNSDGSVADGSTNENGTIQDYGVDYVNFLPTMYRTYTSGTIEYQAKQIINKADKDGDLELSAEEYGNLMSQTYYMSSSMGEYLVDIYGGGNETVSFEELVAAYNSFDSITVDKDGEYSAGADDALCYEEMIMFQNSLTPIQIDPTDITSERYSGLYNTAASVMKTADEDKDGEISVEEYKQILKQQYAQANSKNGTTEVTPEWAAENFVRNFDLDKNGTVDAVELMNVYSSYDNNLDGSVTNAEASDLNAKLMDKTLWTSVNEQVLNGADADGNAKLSIAEYKNYLKDNGMPEILADSAFAVLDLTNGIDINDGFDMDGDGQLSRLELMEAFSRYDGSAVNTDFITEVVETVTGTTGFNYNLYAGDKDNTLDSDEKMKMFEDLANRAGYKNSDGTQLNFSVQHSKVGQYAPIMQGMQEFTTQVDFNKDGLVSAEEYKTYLEIQDLPAYMADNAVNNTVVDWDLNNDDTLDYVEWLRVNLQYDTNANGELSVDEVLNMTNALGTTGITVTASNKAQYEKLYEKASIIIENFDKDDNKILTSDELGAYLKQYGLPDTLAQQMVNAFSIHNDTADGFQQGLDVMELVRTYASFDTNLDGALDFGEEFTMYDSASSVDLGINSTNATQYSKINAGLKDVIKKYDLDTDTKLNVTELNKFFTDKGISTDATVKAMTSYDNDGTAADGALDMLELMNMYRTFDVNLDGTLGNQENLAMFDNLESTDLNPTNSNEIQLTALEKDVDAVLKKYDVNTDKKLSISELQNYMKALSVPDYLADAIINNTAGYYGFDYDQDGDDTLDKLELMKLKADFDLNDNGALELNEELTLYNTGAGTGLAPTADDVKQYSALLATAKKMFTQKDKTTDRILTAAELGSYFTALNLPANMAQDAITLYNNNGDSGLDVYEWTETQVRFDTNKNGTMDFNEQLAFLGEVANPDINFNPAATDATKVKKIYDYAVSNIKKYGGSDKMLSGAELRSWMQTTWAVSADNANEIVNHYDNLAGNGDGNLSALEFAKVLVDCDINGDNDGAWDKAEIMSFIDNGLASVDLGTVNAEKLTLQTNANNIINKYAGSDKELAEAELSKWLVSTWGVNTTMANQIISHYDNSLGDGNGRIDANELAATMIQLDINNNAKFDNAEIMNFIDNALPTVDFGGVNDANVTEKYNLYKTAFTAVNANAGSDKEMSNTELSKWLVSTWGVNAAMASQIISHYDNSLGDGNGTINTAELAQIMMSLDSNNNGKFDNSEIMNFIDNALPAIDFGGVNDANVTQKYSVFNKAHEYINNFAGSDKELTAAEIKNWLANKGISSEIAEQILSRYDSNGNATVDVNELAQILINLEANDNNDGTVSTQEILNLIDNAVNTVNLGGVSNSNIKQVSSLYTSALTQLKSLDKDNDQKISATEYYTYYLSKLGVPQYVANGFISAYDKNGDGVDIMELAESYIGLDTNKTGAIELNETMAMYQTIANAGAGANIFNFNPSLSNKQQLTNAFDTYKAFVLAHDTNADKLVQADEYAPLLKKQAYVTNAAKAAANAAVASLGSGATKAEKTSVYNSTYASELTSISTNMAANAANIYDLNYDGGLDTFEWMDAILNFDLDGDGKLSTSEQKAFYDSIK